MKLMYPASGRGLAKSAEVGERTGSGRALRGFAQDFALIGLKHSGKTHHGRRLAKYLDIPFFDLDNCILKAHPSAPSIRQLYRQKGENWFRAAELAAFSQLPPDGLVLATGGGSMENRPLIAAIQKRRMLTLFLDLPENILFERIQRRGFPPYLETDNPQKTFHEIYERRRPIARDAADICIRAADMPKKKLFAMIKESLDNG